MKKVIVAAVAAMSVVGFGVTNAAPAEAPAPSSGSTMIELKAAAPALLSSSHTLQIGSSKVPLRSGVDRFTTNASFAIRSPQVSAFWVYYDGNRCGWDVESMKLLGEIKSGKMRMLTIHKLNIDLKSETACVAAISGATSS